ncbi:MAG TPA: hypothetical protein VF590_23245 [Isosphaeraceae bacterium]
MRLSLDDGMRERLRRVRESQLEDARAGRPQVVDEMFIEEEVVRLTSGGGHSAYLGLDGRVHRVNYGEGFPPVVLDDPRDIAFALVRWAGDIGLPELVDLLPPAPKGDEVCSLCRGTRFMPAEIMAFSDGRPLYCRRCGGLGWIVV